MPPCVFSCALNTTQHIEALKNPQPDYAQLKNIFHEKFIATLQTTVFSPLEGTIVINKSFGVLKYMKEEFSDFLHLDEPRFHKWWRLLWLRRIFNFSTNQVHRWSDLLKSWWVKSRLEQPGSSDTPTRCPSPGGHAVSPKIKALPYCFKFQSKEYILLPREHLHPGEVSPSFPAAHKSSEK